MRRAHVALFATFAVAEQRKYSGRVIERAIRDSRAIDTEVGGAHERCFPVNVLFVQALCVLAGEKV